MATKQYVVPLRVLSATSIKGLTVGSGQWKDCPLILGLILKQPVWRRTNKEWENQTNRRLINRRCPSSYTCYKWLPLSDILSVNARGLFIPQKKRSTRTGCYTYLPPVSSPSLSSSSDSGEAVAAAFVNQFEL